MIVPRHIKCDLCGEESEWTKYYTIPSRQKVAFIGDSYIDREKYHACGKCFWKMKNYISMNKEEEE